MIVNKVANGLNEIIRKKESDLMSKDANSDTFSSQQKLNAKNQKDQ